jgi:formylglycine-generating enzyme required for sulfatase activity
MSGNVWEWCQDWYAEHYNKEPQMDPSGPIVGSERVCRGGSWVSEHTNCRVSSRDHRAPSFKTYNIGLRLAL